jgi:hypothetical protein
MKATLKNLVTGESVSVHSTTDNAASSYGREVWADDAGQAYGEVDSLILGYEIIERPEDKHLDTRVPLAKLAELSREISVLLDYGNYSPSLAGVGSEDVAPQIQDMLQAAGALTGVVDTLLLRVGLAFEEE